MDGKLSPASGLHANQRSPEDSAHRLPTLGYLPNAQHRTHPPLRPSPKPKQHRLSRNPASPSARPNHHGRCRIQLVISQKVIASTSPTPTSQSHSPASHPPAAHPRRSAAAPPSSPSPSP